MASSEILPSSQVLRPGEDSGDVSLAIQGVWTDKDTEGHVRNSGILPPWSQHWDSGPLYPYTHWAYAPWATPLMPSGQNLKFKGSRSEPDAPVSAQSPWHPTWFGFGPAGTSSEMGSHMFGSFSA